MHQRHINLILTRGICPDLGLVPPAIYFIPSRLLLKCRSRAVKLSRDFVAIEGAPVNQRRSQRTRGYPIPGCFVWGSLTFMALSILNGCAARPVGIPEQSQRIQELERALRRKKAQIEDLRERNLVLERRDQERLRSNLNANDNGETAVPIAFDPSAGGVPVVSARELLNASTVNQRSKAAFDVPSLPQLAPARLEPDSSRTLPALPIASSSLNHEASGQAAPVESLSAAKTGEHFLYSKILETYRVRNVAEMEKATELLIKTYPDSVFADNSLYISGLLAFEANDMSRAEKYMERVIREYPRGNKVAAALFAKASVEKRQRKYDVARRTFHQILVSYPGSPEAARVATELKLLENKSAKKKEI
jgi:TolA-binding protein